LIQLLAFGIGTLLTLFLPLKSRAAPACPHQIASIEDSKLSTDIAEIMNDIYTELGCDTDFVSMPSKRGIQSFNKSKVDGEVFRLRAAEKRYKIPFVRSQEPILTLKNSLWENSNTQTSSNKSIAYVLGIVWQENYMKGKQGKAFRNFNSMFDAYMRGSVTALLASETNIKTALEAGELQETPTMKKIILEAPIYHYLHKDYQPFMEELSAYIRRKKPFQGY